MAPQPLEGLASRAPLPDTFERRQLNQKRYGMRTWDEMFGQIDGLANVKLDKARMKKERWHISERLLRSSDELLHFQCLGTCLRVLSVSTGVVMVR